MEPRRAVAQQARHRGGLRLAAAELPGAFARVQLDDAAGRAGRDNSPDVVPDATGLGRSSPFARAGVLTMDETIDSREYIARQADRAARLYLDTRQPQHNPYMAGTTAAMAWDASYRRSRQEHEALEGTEASA